MCRESLPEYLTECIRGILFLSQSFAYVLRDYLDRLQPPECCFIADTEVKRQVSYVVEFQASYLRGAAPLCAHGTASFVINFLQRRHVASLTNTGKKFSNTAL